MKPSLDALDALPYMLPQFRATFDLAAKQVRAAGRLDLAARLYTFVVLEEDDLADMAGWDLFRELTPSRFRPSYGQWCDDVVRILVVALAMVDAFTTLDSTLELRALEREAEANDGVLSSLMTEVGYAAHG